MVTFILLIIVVNFLFLLLYKNGLDATYSKFSFFILYLALVLIVGLRGEGVDHDYTTYLISITKNETISEPTYLIISLLISSFNLPTVLLFLLYAILGIGIKLYVIDKYSKLPIIAILIYLCNFLLLHDINQIRAGVASAFILLSVPFLAQKERFKFCLCIISATLFHFSSFIAFILLFITNNKLSRVTYLIWFILPILGLGIHLISLDIISFIPIDSVRSKLEMYKYLEEIGTEGFAQANLFNLYFLFKLFIYYFFLFKYCYYKEDGRLFNIYLKIYGISLFLFPSLSSITPLLGYRTSELIGIIEILLFPYLFTIFKTKNQAKCMVVLYVILLFSINIFYKRLIFLS